MMRGVKLLSVLCLLGVLLAGCAQPEQDTLNYYADIRTVDVAALAITLGRGETFEGRLVIWRAQQRERIFPLEPGSLMFCVLDPYHEVVLDAGQVEGEYEFTFTAETSGKYLLVFDDVYGDCTVAIYHNYGGEVRYLGVIPQS